MKRLVSILLLAALALALVSCGKVKGSKEVTCEDIVRAYEEAGYSVWHANHRQEEEGSWYCYLKITEPGEGEEDSIYFNIYFSEEQARQAAKDERYRFGAWLVAAVLGEMRWLRVGSYGTITYSYFNKDLIVPFEELVK